MYRIYLITNLITNKKYIGQTNQDIKSRFEDHWKEAVKQYRTNCYLHNSMVKHGIENFSLELIEDNIPEELIDDKESYYIDKYNTFYLNGHGYNMTRGGQGIHGYKHTNETKLKQSAASLAMWDRIKNNPEEYNRLCQIRSINHKGWKPTEETLKKMKDSAYPRDGELNPFYGKHHSDESRKLISEAQSNPVNMINKDGIIINSFNSCKEAAQYIYDNKDKFVNVSATKPSTISSRITKVVRGEAKTAYGYIWKIKCID